MCELGLFSEEADKECDHRKPSACSPYPTCQTPSTGAYSASSEYVSESQNWLAITSLFPRSQRGVSFRILKFWCDQGKIHLKNLGTGIFWAFSADTKHFWKHWPKFTMNVDRIWHTSGSLHEFRDHYRNFFSYTFSSLDNGIALWHWTIPISERHRTKVLLEMNGDI